jgi:hypothetical protein
MTNVQCAVMMTKNGNFKVVAMGKTSNSPFAGYAKAFVPEQGKGFAKFEDAVAFARAKFPTRADFFFFANRVSTTRMTNEQGADVAGFVKWASAD